jgi:GMP synthase-like glutamine amidotransferase
LNIQLTDCCHIPVYDISCCLAMVQVLQLPPGAVLLVSSPTATNELWFWGRDIMAGNTPIHELIFCCCCCCLVRIMPHRCRQQVLQLPPGAVLLATSLPATNELWFWGPNILASQFHVEFDEPLVLQKIWNIVARNIPIHRLTFGCCLLLVRTTRHCRCQQVLQLPQGAVLLATSPTATNELWSWGPNILASQFHVEFDEALVLQKIWATLRDVGRLDERQAEESRRVLEAGGQMNASMLQVGNQVGSDEKAAS